MVISFINVGKYKADQCIIVIIVLEKGNLETMNLVLEMLSFRCLRGFH